MRATLEHWLNSTWYADAPPPAWLTPFEWLYRLIHAMRRLLYRTKILKSWKAPVPVIVIGNITAGGTGKTPVTMALVKELKTAGWNPGVISRGHGVRLSTPRLVSKDSLARDVGDEPLLIARQSGVPVCVHPRRAKAAQMLLAQYPVDILVADDGLQHLALERDIEIVVIDGERMFGNGHLLPAGPLRERESKLVQVDIVISNGVSDDADIQMQYKPRAFVNVKSGKLVPLTHFQGKGCVAVAGIGNPRRFFETLDSLDIHYDEHVFPDHHRYSRKDFADLPELPVLMTAKDAVKCETFASEDWWFLHVAPEFSQAMLPRIENRLQSLKTLVARSGADE